MFNLNKTKERLHFFIIRIVYIILIPIVLYDMLIIAQTIINPYETPNFLGIKTFNIISR